MHTSLPPSPISQFSLLKQLLGCLVSANFRNLNICLLLHIKILTAIDKEISLILEIRLYSRVITSEDKTHEYQNYKYFPLLC